MALLGDYLAWLPFYALVRWWHTHTPLDIWNDVFEEEFYSVLALWQGADRVEWNLKRKDSDVVISRLARIRGLRPGLVKQLVREGQKIDRALARQHESWTLRWFIKQDSRAIAFLGICKRRLGKRRRLPSREALELWQDLKTISRGLQRWWEESIEESIEARKQNRPRRPSRWIAEVIADLELRLSNENPT